jgi:hypothetical protein
VVDEKDTELFPTISDSKLIFLVKGLIDMVGYLLDHLIALLVSIGVIVGFEEVNIEHNTGYLLVLFDTLIKIEPKMLIQKASIA